MRRLVTVFIFLLSVLLIGASGDTQTESGSLIEIISPVYDWSVGDLIINEIAWMGTSANSRDEWIELFNTTNQELNLSGCILSALDGTPQIELNGLLASQDYYLLEQGNDQVLDLVADQIYKGGLSNDGEILRLLSPNGVLLDQVRGWEAGDNDLKRSMERNGDNWQSNNGWQISGRDRKGKLINGTPSKANSLGLDIIPEEPEIVYDYSDRIFISEILPNPESGEDEFIELYSREGRVINLFGWQMDDIRDQGSNPYTFSEKEIKSGQYLIIKKSESKLNLNNKGDEVYLIDPEGEIIDQVIYSKAAKGQSFIRDEDNWVWTTKITMGQENEVYPRKQEVQVDYVFDGDTIEVSARGETWKVRLIGVDAPETHHPRIKPEPFGKEATDYLRQRILGKKIILDYDKEKKDRYERELAYVYLDKILINQEIIAAGWAEAYRDYDFKYLEEFIDEEKYAQNKKRGMWYIEEERKIGVDPVEYSDQVFLSEIMPNPIKDQPEWVEICNRDQLEVDLQGWQLDDVPNGGSKIYLLKDSLIMGADKCLVLDNLSLKLNNTADQVVLLNPVSEIQDQTSYEKSPVGESWAWNKDRKEWQWTRLVSPGEENMFLSSQINDVKNPTTQSFKKTTKKPVVKNIVFSQSFQKVLGRRGSGSGIDYQELDVVESDQGGVGEGGLLIGFIVFILLALGGYQYWQTYQSGAKSESK